MNNSACYYRLEEERNRNKLLTEKMAQSATKEMDFFFKVRNTEFYSME